MSQIILLLKSKPMSTGEIARNLGLAPSEISKHVSEASKHGFVRYDAERECYALP